MKTDNMDDRKAFRQLLVALLIGLAGAAGMLLLLLFQMVPSCTRNLRDLAPTVQVMPVAGLTVTKTDTPDPVVAGTTLTYILIVTNDGFSDTTGLVVTDTLDPNVSYAYASPEPTGFSSGNPYWSLPPLGPGDSDQITLGVQVHTPLTDGLILSNTAWFDADQTAPLSATQRTTVYCGPVLTLAKTSQPDPVDAGGVLRYTLVLANTGNEDATSVTVTEHYDSNVSFFFSYPTPNPGSGNRVWTFPTLAVGSPEAIDIIVTVHSPLPVGTVLTNQVTLDSAKTAPVTITQVTPVTATLNLKISKVDLSDPVQAGTHLVYIISYQNRGTAEAIGVVITETYDSRVRFVSADPDPEGGTDNVWYIGDLPVNQSDNIIVTVHVNKPVTDGIVLTNCVTIDSAYTAPQSFTEATQLALPDLSIEKVGEGHAPSLFSPGKQMAFTVTYGNAGPGNAHNVIITTTLPTGTDYVNDGQGWRSSGNRIYTYAVGDLPAGSMGHTVTFTVVYADQLQIGTPEFNTLFTIAGEGDVVGAGDTNPANNTTSVYIGVPDLVVADWTVEPVPELLKPYEPVTFTVVLVNQGTGMAWNPDNRAGFWVDVFTAPVPSCPYERDGELYAGVDPIAPGAAYTIVFTHDGFSKQQIEGIQKFYAKVDNCGLYPYGLVPESDEMNNLGEPMYRICLPLILKNWP